MMIRALSPRHLLSLVAIFAALNSNAQALKNVSFKLNLGTSFSSPKDELAKAYRKGSELQLFSAFEVAKHFNYGKDDGLGIRLGLAAGYDKSNLLRNDAVTQLNVSITNFKARVYPLSFAGKQSDMMEGLGKIMMKFPPIIDIPVAAILVGTFNSLHFDYGTGSGKITESTYIDDPKFPEQTINRSMRYFGWGAQPQLLQSHSQKWTMNAVFDFGKYQWTNNSGTTSSIKYSYLGFGVQYHIK